MLRQVRPWATHAASSACRRGALIHDCAGPWMKVTFLWPSSARCSTTCFMPSPMFCITELTSRTTRLITTTGFCLAVWLMKSSDMRGEIMMMPSARSSVRSTACCSSRGLSRPSTVRTV